MFHYSFEAREKYKETPDGKVEEGEKTTVSMIAVEKKTLLFYIL